MRVATPIFRYGPAQSFGPDFSLQQGQHVVMLSKEFGYSRIMTDDGQSGYVATEDLVVAPPPAPKPTPNPTYSRGLFSRSAPLPPRGTSRPGVSSANNRVLESGPLFGEGELPALPPLPEKDPLQSAGPSKPGFRVNVPAPAPAAQEPKPKPGFRVKVPEAH